MKKYNINEVITFNDWNYKKKTIQFKGENLDKFPKVGEVWFISMGKNIGYEQNGSGKEFERPVLIIRKWNNHMMWCVPLSTKQKELDFYYNFTDESGREVSAILAQFKLISANRCRRKLYLLDNINFDRIISKLKTYI